MEIRSKVVTCRKEHNCEWCSCKIKIGEMAYYRVTVVETFSGDWMHVVCYEAMKRVPDVTGISNFVWDTGSHPKGGINEDEIIDEFNA